MSNRPSILVMGVSGAGKSTIGNALGERLGYQFIDGDDLHSPDAIAKMQGGTPLNDDDRTTWLRKIQAKITQANQSGTPVIVGASLLKKKYRDLVGSQADPKPLMVLLSIPIEESLSRLSARSNHFMPAALAQSQFEILEESDDLLKIDATSPIDALLDSITTEYKMRMVN